MQRIRIVIANGKAQSVEIKDVRQKITAKRISQLLRPMPREMLAKALGIKHDAEIPENGTVMKQQ